MIKSPTFKTLFGMLIGRAGTNYQPSKETNMPYSAIHNDDGTISPNPQMYEPTKEEIAAEKAERKSASKTLDLAPVEAAAIRYDLNPVTDVRLRRAYEIQTLAEAGDDREATADLVAKFGARHSTGTYKNSTLEARYKGFAKAIQGVLLTEISIQDLVSTRPGIYD